MKIIFIIFKGYSLKQIKQFFLEGESPTLRYVKGFWFFTSHPHFEFKFR